MPVKLSGYMVQAGRRRSNCETCTSAEPCKNRLKPAENRGWILRSVIERVTSATQQGKFYLLSTDPSVELVNGASAPGR